MKNDYFFHFAWTDAIGQPRLRYGDRREVVVGATYTVYGRPIELCRFGLHASKHVIDALCYATTPACLCLVTLGKTRLSDESKTVSDERTVIAMLSVDETKQLLIDVACRIVLLLGKEELALFEEVVLEFLKTRDPGLIGFLRTYYPRGSETILYSHKITRHIVRLINGCIFPCGEIEAIIQEVSRLRESNDTSVKAAVIFDQMALERLLKTGGRNGRRT